MDSTKAASILAANKDLTIDQLVADKIPNKPVTKILIPSTSGTGSEWSYASVITTDTLDGLTKPFFSQYNFPEAVIIDSELTKYLPQSLTAETGMDALAHAIESFTCSNANIVSEMFSTYAIQLIADNLRQGFAKGEVRIEARYNLAIAASTSGLGLAHFMNVGLGKKAHISHGKTVALLLPFVMDFNLISNPSKFSKIAQLMGEKIDNLNQIQAAEKSINAVRKLSRDLRLPQNLMEIGIGEEYIAELVEELFEFQEIPIRIDNPRQVSKEDAVNIYNAALNYK
jgi:alcohol dehydrogenase class IV